jgi:hypothetical protein
MELAKELLEKGERDVVVSYLQSCAKILENGWRPIAELDHHRQKGRHT